MTILLFQHFDFALLLVPQLLHFLANAAILALFGINRPPPFLLHLLSDACLLFKDTVKFILCLIVGPFQTAHLVLAVGQLNLDVVKASSQHTQVLIKHSFGLLLLDEPLLDLLQARLVLGNLSRMLFLHFEDFAFVLRHQSLLRRVCLVTKLLYNSFNLSVPFAHHFFSDLALGLYMLVLGLLEQL